MEQYIPLSFDRQQPCWKIIQSDASRLPITHALRCLLVIPQITTLRTIKLMKFKMSLLISESTPK